jgi:predicted TIM-barrel fold metal-dependent hydrolase
MSGSVTGTTRSGPNAAPTPAVPGLIDCDLHNTVDSDQVLDPYLPEQWREYLRSFGNRRHLGTAYPPLGNRTDVRAPDGHFSPDAATTVREHLDPHAVAHAILIPNSTAALGQNRRLDAAIATAVNDWQAAEWLDADDRFRASILVAPDATEAAVVEIDRRAADPRFVQLKLNSSAGEPLGSRRYWPIYEACVRHGLPVMTHAYGHSTQPPTASGWPISTFGEHADTAPMIQATLASLIFGGAFDTFPSLRVVCVEYGFGWLPALGWRLDSAWRLLSSEVPDLQGKPSEYLATHVYLTTQPIEEPESPHRLDSIFDRVPWLIERLMFSSDYPHWDADWSETALPAFLPAALREAVYRGNARRLYRLP